MNLLDSEIFTELAHLASHIDSKMSVEIDLQKEQFPVTVSVGKYSWQARELNNTVLLAALTNMAMNVKGELDAEKATDEEGQEGDSTAG